MAIPQLYLLGRKTYPAWTSALHPVGLGVAGSIIHAGILDWAGNLAQLRDLERARAPTIRGGVITPADQHHGPRVRVSKHARRIFIWGFIGVNVAVWAMWARATDAVVVVVPKPTLLLHHLFKKLSPPQKPEDTTPLRQMVENFALTTQNLRSGRWWTILSCGVSHAGLGHLLANMGEFYVWASRCFDLGVGVEAVAGLMVGSGVCSGLACLLEEDARRPGVHVGASGIVCGLQAAAILLEPVMGFRVPGIGDYRYYIFMTLLTGRVGDLVGLLFQRLELAAPWLTGGGSQTRIGYAGHLGGTAFGVAYWWFWLRSRFGTW